MDALIYFLSLIASFLGLFAGMLVSNLSVEEINFAAKYLKYLNLIILPLTVLVVSFSITKIYAILLALILFIVLFFTRNRHNNVWAYSCCGALFYLSTISNTMLNAGVLIFIYGMSISTLMASDDFKNKASGKVSKKENVALIKKMFEKYWYYLAVGAIFFVLFNYVV